MHNESVDSGLPLVALLQQAVRWFGDELVERLRAAGIETITPAHAIVLAHLHGGTSLTIAELARRAGVTRQTMHSAVTQLVGEGLLSTRPGGGFPRTTIVELTDVGARRLEVASGILDDLEREVSERIGRTAFARLRECVTQIPSGGIRSGPA